MRYRSLRLNTKKNSFQDYHQENVRIISHFLTDYHVISSYIDTYINKISMAKFKRHLRQKLRHGV